MNIQRSVHAFAAGLQAFAARDGGSATNTTEHILADLSDDLLLQFAMDSKDYYLRGVALSNLVLHTTNEALRTEAIFELAQLCGDMELWELQYRYLQLMRRRCEEGHGRRFLPLAVLGLGRNAFQRGAVEECFRLTSESADLYLAQGNAKAAYNTLDKLSRLAMFIDPQFAEATACRATALAATPEARARAEKLIQHAQSEQEPHTLAFRHMMRQTTRASTAEEVIKNADEYLRAYPSSPHCDAVNQLRTSVLHKQSAQPKPVP